jgi:hypothetical protein
MPITQDCILAWDNLVDDPATTVTASSEASADYAAANLQEPELDLTWRSADLAATPTLTIDLGSEQDWQLVALPLVNFTPGGTTVAIDSSNNGADWTSQGSAQIHTDVNLYWPRQIAQRKLLWKAWDAAISSRYVRFGFTTLPAEDHYEAARAFVGPLWQPGVNMDYGFTFDVEEGTEEEKTPTGSPHYFAGRPARIHQYEFSRKLTESEMVDLGFDLLVAAGRRHDLLSIPIHTGYTSRAQFWAPIWGRITEYKAPSIEIFERWSAAITIKERLP